MIAYIVKKVATVLGIPEYKILSFLNAALGSALIVFGCKEAYGLVKGISAFSVDTVLYIPISIFGGLMLVMWSFIKPELDKNLAKRRVNNVFRR